MAEHSTRITITQKSLREYFQGRLAACSAELNPPPTDDAQWYLGVVLDRFMRTDSLFEWTEGHYQLKPLALLYDEALSTSDRHHRCLLLQQLGDCALFLGALFPERYQRRGIRYDYFVGMGGGAYDYLSENARQGRDVFAELAENFASLMSLIAKACEEESAMDDARVIELYRRWQRSKSPELAQRLKRQGIDVDANVH